jgi:NAD+-dependent protein deacetylase sirtuin 4
MTADESLSLAVMALQGKRVVVLTGAGISTDSGIPDYRGEGTKQRARNPVRFAEFIASAHAQRRYWARAMVGWPRIRDAVANAAHHALSSAQQEHRIVGLITQNVDGLHGKAGNTDVVELHGALRLVRCLACDARVDRDVVQATLHTLNPHFQASGAAAPDGDVDLDDDAIASFVVPSCACGGAYKPHVVFFGENVEPQVLAQAWERCGRANALLVVGSSLEVFSGRRFVEHAHRQGWPIVLLNHGTTRANGLVTVHIDGGAGQYLAPLLAALPAHALLA